MSIGTPPRGGYWAVNFIFGLVVGFGFIALMDIGYRLIWGVAQ
jgi:hypothetical protein